MKRVRMKQRLLALAAALVLGTTLGTAQAAKPLAQTVDLSGAHFTVGSKEFTEQEILGQITVQLLQAAGAEVKDETGMAGSNAVRKALFSGKVDMYWEYTGTGWISYLKHSGKDVPQDLYPELAKQDMEKNDVKWLKPANFSNTYAIAVNQATADKYQLKTLDDLGRLIKEHPDVATLCVGNEFSQRDDGLLGLEKAYGWHFPQDNVSVLQESLVYQQAAQGSRCNFADVFLTDGRIPALHLVTLEDNRHFFPPYYAALTIRGPVFEKYPQLAELFGPVSKALDMDTMRRLNSEVDVQGRFAKPVAHEFLVSHGFIAK